MASKKQDSNDGSINKSSKQKTDDKPVKVDKWDNSAVKNALDDAVKKMFTEKLKYVENHRLMDGRLAISGIAVGTAMFALVWDYYYPFPLSRPILIACVTTYFILMGILTLYTTFLEKGIFLVAFEKDPSGLDPDQVWTVSSTLKRFDDKYHLSMIHTSGNSKKSQESSLEKSVSSWFDEKGNLIYDLFEQDLIKLHAKLCEKKIN
ncbi:signal peptidase complex subunit 2-like [Centruroides vittatus]|uniref:signal peptidase complex subunit 2-like n=1 Tax=Centruroides vittatus TaxID=120091 RepID=UPI00350F8EDD